MVIGPVSGATYTFDDQDSTNGIITKFSSDGSQDYSVFQGGFLTLNDPIVISSDEAYLYAILHGSRITIHRFQTGNGVPNFVWSNTEYITTGTYPQLRISSDNTILYFTALDSVNSRGIFCRLNLLNYDLHCHRISGMASISILNDLGSGKFFISGKGSTGDTLKMMKLTFGTTTPVWNKDITCDTTN
jgi:hypothetical protein